MGKNIKTYLYSPADEFLGEIVTHKENISLKLKDTPTYGFSVSEQIDGARYTKIDKILDEFQIEVHFGDDGSPKVLKERFIILGTPKSFNSDIYSYNFTAKGRELELNSSQILSWPGVEKTRYTITTTPLDNSLNSIQEAITLDVVPSDVNTISVVRIKNNGNEYMLEYESEASELHESTFIYDAPTKTIKVKTPRQTWKDGAPIPIQPGQDPDSYKFHYKITYYTTDHSSTDTPEKYSTADGLNIQELVGSILSYDGRWTVTNTTDEWAQLNTIIRSGFQFNNISVYKAFQQALDSYGLIAIYDRIKREIKLYKEDEYGKDLGLTLEYGKYLKSISTQEDSANIYTVIKGLGKDGKTLSGVTASGQNSYEDYTYYIDGIQYEETSPGSKTFRYVGSKRSRWMSEDLALAIAVWQNEVVPSYDEEIYGAFGLNGIAQRKERLIDLIVLNESKKIEADAFAEAYGDLLEFYDSLTEEEKTQYDSYQKEYRDQTYSGKSGYRNYLNAVIDFHQQKSTDYKTLIDDFNNKKPIDFDETVAINNNDLNNYGLNALDERLIYISTQVARSNDNGWDEQLRQELKSFQKEYVYTNQDIDNAYDLLEDLKAQTKNLRTLQVTYTISAIDILGTDDARADWNKIQIGSRLNILFSRLLIDIEAQIREVTINVEGNSMSFKVSNTKKYRKTSSDFLFDWIKKIDIDKTNINDYNNRKWTQGAEQGEENTKKLNGSFDSKTNNFIIGPVDENGDAAVKIGNTSVEIVGKIVDPINDEIKSGNEEFSAPGINKVASKIQILNGGLYLVDPDTGDTRTAITGQGIYSYSETEDKSKGLVAKMSADSGFAIVDRDNESDVRFRVLPSGAVYIADEVQIGGDSYRQVIDNLQSATSDIVTSQQLSDAVDAAVVSANGYTDSTKQELEGQIEDNKIDFYYKDYAPHPLEGQEGDTVNYNVPASDWRDSADPTKQYSIHIGDQFYDTRPAVDGGEKTYRWTGTYWIELSQGDAALAQQLASEAKAIADGKATVYYARQVSEMPAEDIMSQGTRIGLNEGDLLLIGDIIPEGNVEFNWTNSNAETIKLEENNFYSWNATSKKWIIHTDIRKLETSLIAQIDGKITTWYKDYIPTNLNLPASDWDTLDKKRAAVGDIFYYDKTIDNVVQNKAWRWTETSNEVFEWVEIKDSQAIEALDKAAEAKSAADGKTTVWYASTDQPSEITGWETPVETAPQEGDLMMVAVINGSYLPKNIYRRNDSGGWSLISDLSGAIDLLQNEVDKKINTYYFNYAPGNLVEPEATWIQEGTSADHVGDLFYDTREGYEKVYRYNGSTWDELKNSDALNAKAIAEGKMTIYYAAVLEDLPSTENLNQNDLLVCNGDFTSAGTIFKPNNLYSWDTTSNRWLQKNDVYGLQTQLENQLDGKISTFFLDGVPTRDNAPADQWIIDDTEEDHKDDMYYDTTGKLSYRWMMDPSLDPDNWNWVKIENDDINTLNTNLSQTNIALDGKTTVYIAKNSTQYYNIVAANIEEGDLLLATGDFNANNPEVGGDSFNFKKENTYAYENNKWVLQVDVKDIRDIAEDARDELVNTVKKDTSYSQVVIDNAGLHVYGDVGLSNERIRLDSDGLWSNQLIIDSSNGNAEFTGTVKIGTKILSTQNTIKNLLSTEHWPVESLTGNFDTYSLYGIASVNDIILDSGPFGEIEKIWKGFGATDSQDGGFNTTLFDIEPNQTYRFSFFLKRNSTGGTSYIGAYNYNSSGSRISMLDYDGTGANDNKYHWSGDLPEINKWYLLVGYINPGGTTINSNQSGIYSLESGKRVVTANDIRFNTAAKTFLVRTYYYRNTSSGGAAWWARPRLDLVNGEEPSIVELLGDKAAKTAGTVGGWTIDSDAIYTGNKDTSGYTSDGVTLSAAGGIHSKEFYIDPNGNAYFKGSLVAANGTFSGELTAATGTFEGDLSAAGGTFTGTLSGVNGDFSGTLTSSAGTIGGWLIKAGYLKYSSNLILNASAYNYYTSDNTSMNMGISAKGTSGSHMAIWCGKGTSTARTDSSPFYVRSDGYMKATSGRIGLWNIGSASIWTGTWDASQYTAGGGNFTLSGSGSLHAGSWYIGTDGKMYAKASRITSWQEGTVQIGYGCLEISTPVYLADGTQKRIDEIKEGDELLGIYYPDLIDESIVGWEEWTTNRKSNLRKPVIVRTAKPDSYYRYCEINKDIKITPEHKMMIKRKNCDLWRWSRADCIETGDYLHGWNGEEILVTSAKIIEEEIQVISLDVEEIDNYFAGHVPVVVHNYDLKQ